MQLSGASPRLNSKRRLIVCLADFVGPIEGVLRCLSGMELLRLRCTYRAMRTLCEAEPLWLALCATEELGIGSGALCPEELEALRPFVCSYRALYAQALPLRRVCRGASAALSAFSSPQRASFARQVGAPDMCFCEVYDALNPQRCDWYGARRVFGSLCRKVVELDEAWHHRRLGARLAVPLDVELPQHDNGFEQPLEVRFVFQVDGHLVLAADTFAFSGEGDARWLYCRQKGNATLTLLLDIVDINRHRGSHLKQAIFDLHALLDKHRPCSLGNDLDQRTLLRLLAKHSPATHTTVQCFPRAPADGVWCPRRPPPKPDFSSHDPNTLIVVT